MYPIVVVLTLICLVQNMILHKQSPGKFSSWVSPNVYFLCAGALLGVPWGLALLLLLDPSMVKISLAVAYGVCGIGMLKQHQHRAVPFDPAKHPVQAFFIGALGGLFGGLTAMPLIPPVLWMRWHHVDKNGQMQLVQRFAFVAQFLAAILSVQATQLIGDDFIWILMCAIPLVLLGGWIGYRVFQRIPSGRHGQLMGLLAMFQSSLTLYMVTMHSTG